MRCERIVPMASRDEAFQSMVDRLTEDELREIVEAACDDDHVVTAVRLAAGRAGNAEGLDVLRCVIDDTLRTRRFIDYREAPSYSGDAQPLLAELERLARVSPSQELATLIERAVDHIVGVVLHADDSDGLIGSLVEDLLQLHVDLCATGIADPLKLARWMIRFSFDKQDIFTVDPVVYAKALGDRGVARYRSEVQARLDAGDETFAVRHAEERLATLDGDVDRLIRLLGGDLNAPYQFIRVAEAMAELDRDDDVLAWSTRGIAETTGWQVATLFDLAAAVIARRGHVDQLVDLRRTQHSIMTSAKSYALLKAVCTLNNSWEYERDPARALLADCDRSGLLDVLLSDGDVDQAWALAVEPPEWELGVERWQRLAAAVEPSSPTDAFGVYSRLADVQLETAGRSSYHRAVRHLKDARRASVAAGLGTEFRQHVSAIRERYRRRPALLETLNRAKLT
jgi:hypothetical protein